ncbi:DUF2185 domain-containing protein [Paenibacillus sp. GSMTC-2017]|uniref:immunity protein Imm33 domain-containing protein n=1 Tax=Paenibacillus sp. GSMTC-2017 TaxID=2794350 RepID=UPI0018D6C752|nr:DUF2185 domain-containing protein [Paenibacillus sp. GSMTC-2017]MBH5316520.1 DUF2185 domain-containing protein [Paenibacillus sp. GSMTC-2017]
MTWKLDSVVELHKEAPYTFYLPSDQVIEKLTVGDLVKLIFMSIEELESEYNGERMWVEIISRNGSDFVGKLANQPHYLNSLQYGDLIDFNAIHICATKLDDPWSADMDYYFDNKVVVSNDVLSRNEFNFLLRFNPNNEDDLGWVFFSGHEEEDANNTQVISVGVMLNIDDSILAFINDPAPCAYERDKITSKLLKIEDYDFSIHG